jgi:hypothetical protein
MTDQDPKSGRFVKGNKANPGGHKRTDLSISALIDNAVTEADWLFIIGNLRTKARRGDVKAIEMLMDRRFGKAVTQIAGTGDEKDAVIIRVIGKHGEDL